MIGHSVKGKGFRGCLNYNLNPAKEAEVIGGNMAGQTPRDLAAEFGQVRQLNQRVKSPCWHVSLSAVPGEKLTNDQWNEVADRYLDQMKLDRSQHQYVVIRHYDTKHQHVHIVANRIDYDGRANYLKWHKKDTKKATRYLERQLEYLQQTCKQTERQRAKLEQDYQLPDAESKRGVIQGQYWRVQREQAETPEQSPTPIQQQALQAVIDDVLSQSLDSDDFVKRLAAQGVETRLRLNVAGEPMGVSYQLDQVALPGFALGQSYTWSGIQERLLIQQLEQPDLSNPIQSESVQTSLLPGVVDESKWETPGQRQQSASDGSEHAAEGNRGEASELEQADQADRGADRTRPANGAIAPAGSGADQPGFEGLEKLVRDFAELEDFFAWATGAPETDRRVGPELERDSLSLTSDPRDDSVSAPDLGVIDPEFPRFIESEQGLDRPGESIGESAGGNDADLRSALEPDSAGSPPISEPSQSKLGKSEAYGERIREITEDYQQGLPLSDRAKRALTRDLEVYQHRQKQVLGRSYGLSL